MDFPGEKLAIKVWETLTEKGIGGLLSPWQIRRLGAAHADVRRKEMIALAQAEKDANDLLAGRKALDSSGELVALPSPIETTLSASDLARESVAAFPEDGKLKSLIKSASTAFTARELKRHLNLLHIAVFAEEQARQTPDEGVSDARAENDWLERWRENAQDISAEYMQRVWARILTEELKSPGSYSLDTLDFLRTLSKSEAEKIAKIGPYVLNGRFVYKDSDLLEVNGIPFQTLLELEDIGILSGVQVLVGDLDHFTIALPHDEKFVVVIANHNMAAVGLRNTKEPNATFPAYPCTRRGREIFTLGNYAAELPYLERVAKHLASQGFSVRIGDWENTNDSYGTLRNDREIKP